MQFFLVVIADVKAFQKAVKLAAESALNDNLVTFGIVPTFPATGYGYVKCGAEESEVFALEKICRKTMLRKSSRISCKWRIFLEQRNVCF